MRIQHTTEPRLIPEAQAEEPPQKGIIIPLDLPDLRILHQEIQDIVNLVV